jgi:UDP-N-acetylmuramate--alanine ligase
LLLDIYPAGEVPIPGITSLKLAEEIKGIHCRYFVRSKEAARELAAKAKNGQIFLTLGAGDGWKFGMEILKNLSES